MDPRIHKAICIMTIDLSSEVPLQVLARSFNLSTSRLRHLFKDETGISPIQYLRARRLDEAKLLLETTFLTVKEIMLRIGIKDKSHFVRDFKRIYGDAPFRYRIQYLKDEMKTEGVTRTANL